MITKKTFSIRDAAPTVPAGSYFVQDLETSGKLSFYQPLPEEAIRFLEHAKRNSLFRKALPYNTVFNQLLTEDGYNPAEMLLVLNLVSGVTPIAVSFKSSKRYNKHQVSQAMRGFDVLSRLSVFGNTPVRDAYLQFRSRENSIHKAYLVDGAMRANHGVVLPIWCSEDTRIS